MDALAAAGASELKDARLTRLFVGSCRGTTLIDQVFPHFAPDPSAHLSICRFHWQDGQCSSVAQQGDHPARGFASASRRF